MRSTKNIIYLYLFFVFKINCSIYDEWILCNSTKKKAISLLRLENTEKWSSRGLSVDILPHDNGIDSILCIVNDFYYIGRSPISILLFIFIFSFLVSWQCLNVIFYILLFHTNLGQSHVINSVPIERYSITAYLHFFFLSVLFTYCASLDRSLVRLFVCLLVYLPHLTFLPFCRYFSGFFDCVVCTIRQAWVCLSGSC